MNPSKRIMREAADLLACCASQPESWSWFIEDMPGSWSEESRSIALAEWDAVYARLADDVIDLVWRGHYAEAEAHVRKKLETK